MHEKNPSPESGREGGTEMNHIDVAVIIMVIGVLGLGISCTSLYYNSQIVQPIQDEFDNYKKAIQPMLNPSVLTIYKDDNYTCVNVTSINVTVFRSLSSSEAVQWALDNVWNHTRVSIVEDIKMDGPIEYPENKSYAIQAEGGYLIFNMTEIEK